ncbi:MAG: DeoR/GlpR family DNA-binding transcription regulator [Thermoleophilia bacterium]
MVEILRTGGAITVVQIEERFGVSSMTARRDLGELERTGLARRTHGGAVLPAIAAHEDSFASRLEQAKDAKAALAEAAADLVRESESLFLDSSTTSHHLARVLLERGVRATVISNSMEIFELVATHPALAIDLVGVGGALRRLTRSFVGPYAVHTIAGHAVDRVFFSVKGITSGGALTDPDALESEVKRSMIAHAHEAILLVDESKLSQHGLSVVAEVGDVAQVLAHGISDKQAAALTALGGRVTIVADRTAAA